MANRLLLAGSGNKPLAPNQVFMPIGCPKPRSPARARNDSFAPPTKGHPRLQLMTTTRYVFQGCCHHDGSEGDHQGGVAGRTRAAAEEPVSSYRPREIGPRGRTNSSDGSFLF